MSKSNKFTLVLLSGDRGAPRRFAISRAWLFRLLLFAGPPFVGLFVGALVAIVLYAGNVERIRGYDRVVRQNAEMDQQLEYFAHRVDELTDQLTALKESNARIKVLANLEAHPGKVEPQGVGGPDPDAARLTNRSLDDARRGAVERLHRDLQRLEMRVYSEQSATDLLQDHLREQQAILNFTPSIRPVRGWISSRFGYRNSPFTGRREFHHGIDIVNRSGTPVLATADGRVMFAGYNGGYGRMVVIDHGFGVKTKYGHLATHAVSVGDRVIRGQEIGTLGNSGRSTGPHLHYEVVVNDQTVNPVAYIVD
ncbi:MAG: peptidoglycan DD-metalloendopeptidase family protein [Deltaproteobacteria bacterium]|nr:peptidoglycan DD-metalloendopeptidase family protein [Candidatus Anaeroferrophillacea bacterium]